MKRDKESHIRDLIEQNRRKLDDMLYRGIIHHMSSQESSYIVKRFQTRIFYQKRHYTELRTEIDFLGIHVGVKWAKSRNYVSAELDIRQIASLIRQEYVTRIRSRA